MHILLHICCGTCAAGVAEKLLDEGNKVTGFFYNPNISPEEEYMKRLDAAKKVSRRFNFELLEGEYDHSEWYELVKDKADETEGGERCSQCYMDRFRKVNEIFRKGDYDRWTTTLTVSPHKDCDVINLTGCYIAGEKFFPADFKKKGGFQRAIELSKEMGLYRQDYCGCEFSKRG